MCAVEQYFRVLLKLFHTKKEIYNLVKTFVIGYSRCFAARNYTLVCWPSDLAVFYNVLDHEEISFAQLLRLWRLLLFSWYLNPLVYWKNNIDEPYRMHGLLRKGSLMLLKVLD